MIKLLINTANAAFEGENKLLEVARIITETANKVESDQFDAKLRDFNGNVVGCVSENEGGFKIVPGENYFTLEIETDNAAFEDYGKGSECARIMRKAANKISGGETDFKLHDENGNTVGKVEEVRGIEVLKTNNPEKKTLIRHGRTMELETENLDNKMPSTSLYAELKAVGVEMDHHESDLYVPVTKQTQEILAKYPLNQKNSTTFKSTINGKQMFDIPFAYDPAWEKNKHASATYTVADMRPDIKGKLLAENAVSLDDDELLRVFDGVVCEKYCIHEAQKARDAGITISDIYNDLGVVKIYIGVVTKITPTKIWQEVEPGQVVVHDRAGLGPLPVEEERDDKLNGLMVSIQYGTDAIQKIMPVMVQKITSPSSVQEAHFFGEIVSETNNTYFQSLGRNVFAAHDKTKVFLLNPLAPQKYTPGNGELQIGKTYDIKYKNEQVQVTENAKNKEPDQER